MTADRVGICESHLTLAGNLDDLKNCKFIIEAIIERLDAKRALFMELEAVVSPDTILATNTSSLSVAAIASGCKHKERICGLHFFNPVAVMKLVEVIAAPATSNVTIERATELSKFVGKIPVQVKDGPGFLVNLAGRAYVTEALHIVREGVTEFATVDRIMRDAGGFPMGPFELMDFTGIDVNFPTTDYIYEGHQHDPRLRTTTLHALMFNAGQYGRKTGQGYHNYTASVAEPVDPAPILQPPTTFAATVVETAPGFELLRDKHGLVDGTDAVLVAPFGEDAATVAARMRVDPAILVAFDFTAIERRHITLMAPLGGSKVIEKLAAWLRGQAMAVEIIKDSPGFVLQRIAAMVANLGCELAQTGVGVPEDIDLAMKLAQNYPLGPLEWAEHISPERLYRILANIQAVTGSDRYRPSLWLRRRALLGRSIYERD